MFYEPAKNDHGLPHRPFKAIVAPRPIGWISTLSPDGVANLAPYSYFNAVAESPPVVMFSSSSPKDSWHNAEKMGEFACNMVSFELTEAMNLTSASVAPDVDEFELAGLEKAPCRLIKCPRVAASPAVLECRYVRTVELPGADGTVSHRVIFGEVVGIHIADEVIVDGLVDTTRMRPVGRHGYFDYSVVNEVFAVPRPD